MAIASLLGLLQWFSYMRKALNMMQIAVQWKAQYWEQSM
jgi:hypothetical protein